LHADRDFSQTAFKLHALTNSEAAEIAGQRIDAAIVSAQQRTFDATLTSNPVTLNRARSEEFSIECKEPRSGLRVIDKA